jgi:hypothetical protein
VGLATAVTGAGLAVAASDGGPDGGRLVTATGGFAAVPAPRTQPPVPGGDASRLVEWPHGDDGWTIVLASIPQTEGRRKALARARQARGTGLSPVGVLDSSRYASLHPGYWVVFAGIYASEAEAASALEPARRFSRTATVRRVVH